MAVAITRRDLSAGELRREAARTRDAKAARRMLAIALVLEGRSREDASENCGMDRQTLRDWVQPRTPPTPVARSCAARCAASAVSNSAVMVRVMGCGVGAWMGPSHDWGS